MNIKVKFFNCVAPILDEKEMNNFMSDVFVIEVIPFECILINGEKTTRFMVLYKETGQ